MPALLNASRAAWNGANVQSMLKMDGYVNDDFNYAFILMVEEACVFAGTAPSSMEDTPKN
ncbi:MAG: hypothetical protein ABIS01_02180 [Ferruginibacter sp.]